jgi:secondary thiamine-phosphate synthase enzyme
MDTVVGIAPAHALVRIGTTRATEFIDITDRIQSLVNACGVTVGIVNLQALHTTTAIVVNEHEPLLLADFESTLEHAAPGGARYRHDDVTMRTVNLSPDERSNGHAHCRALLLAASASLNIVDGRLLLGRWQRVFFIELDGPRERVISAVVLGEPRS